MLSPFNKIRPAPIIMELNTMESWRWEPARSETHLPKTQYERQDRMTMQVGRVHDAEPENREFGGTGKRKRGFQDYRAVLPSSSSKKSLPRRPAPNSCTRQIPAECFTRSRHAINSSRAINACKWRNACKFKRRHDGKVHEAMERSAFLQ